MTPVEIFHCPGCHNGITGRDNWSKHKKSCEKYLEYKNG